LGKIPKLIKEWYLKNSNYYKQFLLLGLFISLFLIITYWINGYKLISVISTVGAVFIYFRGIKNPFIRHLENRGGIWIFSYSNGNQINGASLNILWSNPYGMTLKLKKCSRKVYYIVIFADQFSYADEHQLRWLLFNSIN
jgi:hypothetical protein